MESILLNNSIFCCAEKATNDPETSGLFSAYKKGIIDKIRYEILVGKHTFEVDVFSGENQGLIMAEVELSEENEFFEKPNWLGIEVTGDKRFFNSYLSENPFTTWE